MEIKFKESIFLYNNYYKTLKNRYNEIKYILITTYILLKLR